MPKIQTDKALFAEVQAFVDKCGGASRAAALLNVEKTLLWRFYSSGKAIDRNRKRIRGALDAQKSATTGLSETKSEPVIEAETGGRQVSPSSLREMRLMFENMIAMIDAYETLHQRVAH
jgi:hypothetical protein